MHPHFQDFKVLQINDFQEPNEKYFQKRKKVR